MRKGNVFNLLRPVYSAGPLSRAELSEMTGVASGHVSVMVRQALDRGLVLERGFAPSNGGRRRVLLEANPELTKLIGIDVGRANIRFVVTDFVGKVLKYKVLPTEADKGKERVLELMNLELRSMLAQVPGIGAIGISHSGVIDPKAGKVLFWPMIAGWEETPLRQIFEDAYGLPVFVEDCVRAMAIAERRFGHAKGLGTFVFVSVGRGIGSAIFINHHLHVGRDGLAGELGHTTVAEDGDLCSCGNHGCLELCSSATAIVRRVRWELEHGVSSSLTREVGENLDQLSVELIVAAAKSHDRLSERVLSEAGMHLGTALASVVNLLNPEKVILAGKVPQAGSEILLGSLLYNLRQRAFPQAVKNLEVVVSQFGEEEAAIGMVLTAGEYVFQARCREMEGERSASERRPGGSDAAGVHSDTSSSCIA
jgi:N-acetylglucosamine repressor